MMDRTLIVCASHHGVSLETQQCIAELRKHGARLLSSTGVADVALARNQVLTLALAQKGDADVFLLVDDDMVWTLASAAKLVGLARETKKPHSGAYATKDGHLAATPLDWNATRADGLRMVGLGFCAVPVTALERLAAELAAGRVGAAVGSVVGPNGERLIPFCESSVVIPKHDGIPRWCSEDYWLCRSLGGVLLAPYVAAGHLKTVPLWPDDETLRLLAANQPLTGSSSTPPPPPPSEPPTEPDPPRQPRPTPSETPARKRRKNKRNASNQTQP